MNPLAPAVVLALSLSSAAAGACPCVITEPTWAERPSRAALMSNYPTAALALRLEGRASITCVVTVTGALNECSVATESPPELGFGPAALRMATTFHMRPMTVDGGPVSGARVTIPIAFRLPNRSLTLAPSLDPAILALARQLVADMPQMTDYTQRASEAPPLREDSVTPPETRAAAIAALQSVMRAHRGELLDAPARAAVASFSPDELRALIDAESGHRPLQPQHGETAQQLTAKLEWFKEVVEDLMVPRDQFVPEAQAIFCRDHACETLAQVEQPPLPGPVTTLPDWRRRPTGEDLRRVYPPAARRHGIEGKAWIECKVTKEGDLADCQVLAETPPGVGFGAAALQMAGAFNMRPPTKDGRPVEGGVVRIPLMFRLPRP